MSDVATGRAGLHRELWLRAALLLVGLVIGAVGTALLLAQDVRPAQSQSGGAVETQPGGTPTRAGVLVTDECLRAINDAGDALAAIDDAAQAAAELNAARLDEVVRRLQPVQDRLQTNLGGCQAVGQSPGGGASEDDAAPPSDEPLPGLSPTEDATSTTPSPTGAPSSTSPSP